MGNIILNSVYVGNYGYDKHNLPHEMINFIRDDKGRFFIYITPYGTLDKTLKLEDIDAVLFIQSVKNTAGLVEVLAKAVIDHEDDSCKFFTQGIEVTKKGANIKDEKKKETYINLIKKIKPVYGNKSLMEIHKQNKRDNEVHVTFQVSEICLPKKTFYLTNKEENLPKRANVFYIGKEKKIANQSMKTYYNESVEIIDENQSSMEKNQTSIWEIIKDESLWESSDETPKFEEINIKDISDIQKNFFAVTRQQDNEVMFSNMLFYMFNEYPESINKFLEKVLKIQSDSNIIVEREKERMDIRLIGDKQYVIIENKINSPINGMYLEEKDKDNSKYEYFNGYRSEGEKYISQLSKYYELAEEHNKKTKQDRTICGFVLRPNYVSIDENFLAGFLRGDKYTPLNYSEVQIFVDEYMKDNEIEDIYLSEFVKAMQKHTTETDCEYRNVLLARLNERIQSK